LVWQITEFVHKRDVTRELIERRVDSRNSFQWLKQMRFSFNPQDADVLKQLTIEMANARFFYGFEYLGVQDKLVQTPLTDRCYLAMTQALAARLGGSPFGMSPCLMHKANNKSSFFLLLKKN
jgi:dynein heavy chain 1, cytosolic